MTPKPGQLVEYDRQKGAPPVIAVVVECHADTSTVETRCVLDEDNRPLEGFWQRWKFTIPNDELRPARKMRVAARRAASHGAEASSRGSACSGEYLGLSTYQCGVCRSLDPTKWMRCEHPACPDGRDIAQGDMGGAGMSRAATRNPDCPVAGAVKSASPTQPDAAQESYGVEGLRPYEAPASLKHLHEERQSTYSVSSKDNP